MDREKEELGISISVIALTKNIMEKFSIGHLEAFRKLCDTKFFDLLNDPETGLFLKPDEYLWEACLQELEHGTKAMHDYIDQD